MHTIEADEKCKKGRCCTLLEIITEEKRKKLKVREIKCHDKCKTNCHRKKRCRK